MVFSSPTFLFFFLPITLGVYFLLRGEWRNWWLMAVSLLFFVCGDGEYSLVLIGLIGLNYVCGLWVAALDDPRSRCRAMLTSIGLNVAVLMAFKYGNFGVDNLNMLLEWLGASTIHLDATHLPLGISFVTFHAMSYVIDVYRRKIPAQSNAARFALYISFFPQSIAGPIVRYCDIASQLASRQVTRERFASGVQRFIVGMAKKVLIANTVALAADQIFRLPGGELTTQAAWLALTCYTLQIYFDFSGYSDMAIGLGRMFGFEFLENFNYPYAARSVTEFWRRWHISLSTWFRDYLYIPLGGNRCGALRNYVNLLAVFLLCGLWHGASWMFMLWGLYHGVFLVVERLGLGQWIETKLWAPLRHVYTLAAVMLGWALFRVETLPQASTYIAALCGQGHGTGLELQTAAWMNRQLALALVAGVAGAFPLVPTLAAIWDRRLNSNGLNQPSWIYRTVSAAIPVGLLAALFFGSTMQLAAGTYNPFIYFRF
jgi:alginate O-acetyltransferase complex protein AlgI